MNHTEKMDLLFPLIYEKLVDDYQIAIIATIVPQVLLSEFNLEIVRIKDKDWSWILKVLNCW